MDANDYQIGGKHYQTTYQCWDIICDLNLNFLLGSAAKYITRWKDKNGIEDLKKSIHYLAKFEEVGLVINKFSYEDKLLITIFCNQYNEPESTILRCILTGRTFHAKRMIKQLIRDNMNNSDYIKG